MKCSSRSAALAVTATAAPDAPASRALLATTGGITTRRDPGRASSAEPRLAHQGEHLPRGAGAVAVGVLGRGVELGDAAAEAGDEDERVVAEAVRAAWRLEHLGRPATDRDERLGIVGVAHGDEGRDEARATIGTAAQALEQQRVVGGVLGAVSY